MRDIRCAPELTSTALVTSTEKIKTALKCVKPNKAAGIEFILRLGYKAYEWLCVFLSVCLRSKIQKYGTGPRSSHFKSCTTLDDPKGYRPVSLLCISRLERPLQARIDPVIDPKLAEGASVFPLREVDGGSCHPTHQPYRDTFQAGEKVGDYSLTSRPLRHRSPPRTPPQAPLDATRPLSRGLHT